MNESSNKPPTKPIMFMSFMGIDPGVNGGLAYITRFGRVVADPMPDSDEEIWKWINKFKGDHVRAVIEKVGGWIGDGEGEKGGGKANATNAFRFGESFGGLKAFLIAAGIRFVQRAPRTWQAMLDLPKKEGMSSTEWKNVLKEKAISMFPDISITLKTSDALLLAHCSRKIHIIPEKKQPWDLDYTEADAIRDSRGD